MVGECLRHAKAIGGWGEGAATLVDLGLDPEHTAGVVIGDDASSVFAEVAELMAGHRVWDRYPASLE